MSIQDDFKPYWDGNGLLSPWPNLGKQGSDNGVMYTSEYIVMLAKTDQLDKALIMLLNVQDCLQPNGMLQRVPYPLPSSQEGPDDYYALLNACYHTNNTDIPRRILHAVLEYYGFLNNNNPGKKTLSSFLIRQPQLLAAIVSASFPKWNITHTLIRSMILPAYVITAIVIATSCTLASPTDTDARRLAWHLIQVTTPTSILCKLASKLWYKRLYKQFPNGMKDIATMYYHPSNNPWTKWWITE